MDVHPPNHPVLTLKEALVHLAFVTIGIMIALSFDGARAWYEHRVLVKEARQNLMSEIRDNQKMLEKSFLDRVDTTGKDAKQAGTVAQALLEHDSTAKISWKMDYPLISLQSASHTTAEITGAFSYMNYDEVKRFAALYQLQTTFERLHSEGMTAGLKAYGAGTDIMADFKANKRTDAPVIREWKQFIASYDASLILQSQVGTALDTLYKKILSEGDAKE